MDKHRAASAILTTALLLGIAADLLLRWIPWGINVFVWTAMLIAGAAFARRRAESAPLHKFAAMASLVLAAGVAWRDSPMLVALDVGLLLVFLPMLAFNARRVRVAAAGLAELVAGIFTTGIQTIAGFPQLLVSDLSWRRVPQTKFRGAGVAARGTVIAAPALVVFGSLFTSADPTFGQVMGNLISFDVADLSAHLFVTAIFAAATAGFLRSLALSGPLPHVGSPRVFSMPAAETNFALGLLNLLFAAFVAVQFQYFFRGAGMNGAEYARRGFFELVWVVALVLPMLLLVDWLLTEKRMFRLLAGIQIALIFVIALSAWRRMELYRDEFGLTRLRLFTTAFMIWVAALLLWFALTVLTGRRHRFLIGALTTAVATVVILHAINPDALIVETNIARALDGKRPLDVAYVTRLSDDALPAIVAHRDAFAPRALSRYVMQPRPAGWRTWNLSRARADEAVRTLVRSGIKGHAADGAPGPRRRIDPRVQQLPQVRHLQEQVPVPDRVTIAGRSFIVPTSSLDQ